MNNQVTGLNTNNSGLGSGIGLNVNNSGLGSGIGLNVNNSGLGLGIGLNSNQNGNAFSNTTTQNNASSDKQATVSVRHFKVSDNKTEAVTSSRSFTPVTSNTLNYNIANLPELPTFDEYEKWAQSLKTALDAAYNKLSEAINQFNESINTLQSGFQDAQNCQKYLNELKENKGNLETLKGTLANQGNDVLSKAKQINADKKNKISIEINEIVNNTKLSANKMWNNRHPDASKHYNAFVNISDIKKVYTNNGRTPTADELNADKKTIRSQLLAKYNNLDNVSFI